VRYNQYYTILTKVWLSFGNGHPTMILAGPWASMTTQM